MKPRLILFSLLPLFFTSVYAQYGRLHTSLSIGPTFPMGEFRHVDEVSPEIYAESGGALALSFSYDLTRRLGVSLYISHSQIGVKDLNDFYWASYSHWSTSWILPGANYHHNFGKHLRLSAGLHAGVMGASTPTFKQFSMTQDGPVITSRYENSGRVFGMGVFGKGTYYIWEVFGLFVRCNYLYGRPTFSYGKQPIHILQVDLGIGFRMLK